MFYVFMKKASALKAIKFYFEKSEKRLRDRSRETSVTTLNKGINKAKSMKSGFLIPTLREKNNLRA